MICLPENQNEVLESVSCLQWQVHPLRRNPKRLPVLLLTFFVGAMCVWLMFGALLPVLAALLLMAGSIGEYLFPTRYQLSATGATAEGGAGRLKMTWKETRRVVVRKGGILLSPLPAPSRLDAFRGILLRCAPDGKPGNRAEILTFIAQFVPDFVPIAEISPEIRAAKQENAF